MPCETNILRNRGVDQRIEVIETHFTQHRLNFFLIRPDVPAHERINIESWFVHLHRKKLRSARRASTFERRLRRCQSRDRNTERAAAYVIETQAMTEFHAGRFAAMFAANSQFDVRASLASAVASEFHQTANSILIDCCE